MELASQQEPQRTAAPVLGSKATATEDRADEAWQDVPLSRGVAGLIAEGHGAEFLGFKEAPSP